MSLSTLNQGHQTSYVDVGVRRVIEYPDYSSRKLFHDLALLELEKEVELKRNIQVILETNKLSSKALIQISM